MEIVVALKLHDGSIVERALANIAKVMAIDLALVAAVRVKAAHATKLAFDTQAGASTVKLLCARLNWLSWSELRYNASICCHAKPSKLTFKVIIIVGPDPRDIHCLNHMFLR